MFVAYSHNLVLQRSQIALHHTHDASDDRHDATYNKHDVVLDKIDVAHDVVRGKHDMVLISTMLMPFNNVVKTALVLLTRTRVVWMQCMFGCYLDAHSGT